MPILTRAALQRFAPRPASGLRAQNWDDYVAAMVEHGDELLAAAGIDQARELQHFMAQIGHESGGFTILWEDMRYRAPRILEIFGAGRHSAGITAAEADRLAGNPEALAERVYGLGNPRKARELGNTDPGDGYRYRGYGLMQITGRTDHERLLAGDTSPRGSIRAALSEWNEKGCSPLAMVDDVKSITRRINGGFNGLAERRALLARAKSIWPVLAADTPAGERLPPSTMAQSSTGNTALAIGSASGVSAATEVSNAMARVASGGGQFSLQALAMALASSPTFWLGMLTLAGAAYIWLERRRKLIVHGI